MVENTNEPVPKETVSDAACKLLALLVCIVGFIAIYATSVWCFACLTGAWKLMGVLPWLCVVAVFGNRFEIWIFVIIGIVGASIAPNAIDAVGEVLRARRTEFGK